MGEFAYVNAKRILISIKIVKLFIKIFVKKHEKIAIIGCGKIF